MQGFSTKMCCYTHWSIIYLTDILLELIGNCISWKQPAWPTSNFYNGLQNVSPLAKIIGKVAKGHFFGSFKWRFSLPISAVVSSSFPFCKVWKRKLNSSHLPCSKFNKMFISIRNRNSAWFRLHSFPETAVRCCER